jgi:hypothetical protein
MAFQSDAVTKKYRLRHDNVTGFAAKNPSGAGKLFRLCDEDAEIHGQPPSLYEACLEKISGKKVKAE